MATKRETDMKKAEKVLCSCSNLKDDEAVVDEISFFPNPSCVVSMGVSSSSTNKLRRRNSCRVRGSEDVACLFVSSSDSTTAKHSCPF